jgi:hypothetical protein
MACPARKAATSTNEVFPPAAMHSRELAETGSMTMRSTSLPSSDFSKQWARPCGCGGFFLFVWMRKRVRGKRERKKREERELGRRRRIRSNALSTLGSFRERLALAIRQGFSFFAAARVRSGLLRAL